MAGISVQIEGMEQTKMFFEGFADDLREKIDRAKANALRAGYSTATTLVPVRTGRLKRSIRTDEDSLSANTEYAAFVEYGVRSRIPKPYMRPAAEDIAVKLFTELSHI